MFYWRITSYKRILIINYKFVYYFLFVYVFLLIYFPNKGTVNELFGEREKTKKAKKKKKNEKKSEWCIFFLVRKDAIFIRVLTFLGYLCLWKVQWTYFPREGTNCDNYWLVFFCFTSQKESQGLGCFNPLI